MVRDEVDTLRINTQANGKFPRRKCLAVRELYVNSEPMSFHIWLQPDMLLPELRANQKQPQDGGCVHILLTSSSAIKYQDDKKVLCNLLKGESVFFKVKSTRC